MDTLKSLFQLRKDGKIQEQKLTGLVLLAYWKEEEKALALKHTYAQAQECFAASHTLSYGQLTTYCRRNKSWNPRKVHNAYLWEKKGKKKAFSPPLDLTVAHRGQQRAAMRECGSIEKGPAAASDEAVSGALIFKIKMYSLQFWLATWWTGGMQMKGLLTTATTLATTPGSYTFAYIKFASYKDELVSQDCEPDAAEGFMAAAVKPVHNDQCLNSFLRSHFIVHSYTHTINNMRTTT